MIAKHHLPLSSGTIVKAEFGEGTMVVCEWAIFEEKFASEIEKYGWDSYKDYVPVIDVHGAVNGFYPDSLNLVTESQVYIPIKEESKETIEI